MKAMSLLELRTLVIELNELLMDSQLQDVISNDRGLALGFRGTRHFWLTLDMNPANPFCLVFADYCPFKKGSKPKPLALFLNSHGKNLYFRRMWLEEDYGRVLRMELGNSQKNCEIQMILIPRQANMLVESEGKSITWEKPRELQVQTETGELPEPRGLAEMHEEWLGEFQGGARPSIDPRAQWEKKKAKDLEKKRKALEEIEKTLAENYSEKLYELGTYLKTLAPEDFNSKKVPSRWHGFLDFKQKIFANIERVFEKAKQAAGKVQGTEDRRRILVEDIEKLEKSSFETSQREAASRPKVDDLMKSTEAKGRKLHLESGAIVYCGKSAADNLALLRRAKAWDYWLHLKDYPGAHAIVHRSRDQELPYEELQKAALWVLKESLSSRSFMSGEKYAVVLVECRFVRPIKGDKLGRVTYHSEKQFMVTA
jgi:predicted ribosome quality control (RQC) complex YloA/Tae2 family protein